MWVLCLLAVAASVHPKAPAAGSADGPSFLQRAQRGPPQEGANESLQPGTSSAFGDDFDPAVATAEEFLEAAALDYETFRDTVEWSGETMPGDPDYRIRSLLKVNASLAEGRKVWINSPSLHMGWSWEKAGFAHRGANWAYSELEVGPSGRPAHDGPGGPSPPDGLRDYTYWATIVHRRGYMGYQNHLGPDTTVVCSTWDLGDTEYGYVITERTEMTYCAPGVRCKKFGNEGTGLQSITKPSLKIRPRAGTVFRSLLRMEPYEEDAKPRVTISCYFQLDDFNDGKWFHMSTYDGPDHPGQNRGMTPGAFLEQYGWTSYRDLSFPATGIYRMWGKAGADFGQLSDWKHLSEAHSNAYERAQDQTGGFEYVDWGTEQGVAGRGHYMSQCGCTLKEPGVYKDRWADCSGSRAEASKACPVRISQPNDGLHLQIPTETTPPDGLVAFEREVGSSLETTSTTTTTTSTSMHFEVPGDWGNATDWGAHPPDHPADGAGEPPPEDWSDNLW